MRKFKGALETGSGNMRMKLILMSAAALFLIGAVVYLLSTAGDGGGDIGPGAEYEAQLEYALPHAPEGTFDGISDATESERIYVEDAQLEVARAVVRTTTAMGLAAAGVRTLDAAAANEIMAAPAALRGTYFSVRGEVLEVARKLTSPGSSRDEFVGALRTSEGVTVFFRALRTDDEGLARGDWVRVDGLFFKVLRDEVPAPASSADASSAADEFTEGPLLVAPEILRSYPDFGTVTSVAPEDWDMVRDDTLSRRVGPQDAMQWRLLAWMRDLGEGSATEVPEVVSGGVLSEKSLIDMRDSGAAFRGQVFSLPVCRVQIVSVRAAGENPARLAQYSEVWVGNSLWQKQPIIRVLVPGAIEEYPPGTLVTGELVYYMNVAYETATNLSLAPMFVSPGLTHFEPPRDTVLRTLIYGFVALLVVLGVLMAVLARRDQRQSKELADMLVQRRRARRAQTPTGV